MGKAKQVKMVTYNCLNILFNLSKRMQLSFSFFRSFWKEVEAKQEEKEGEKAEEKKVEKAEEKKEEAKPAGPPPPVVLSLDLHCVGCAEKIEKCILKCRGRTRT